VAVSRAVADGIGFDAVFAHNDLSASGVLQSLALAGRPAPDVPVVGFDDAGHAAFTAPPLTTVQRPLREIGAAAARTLAAALAGSPITGERIEIAGEVVMRNSTVLPGNSTALTG
jgi:LacI family transcriptional regulator